MKTTKRMYMHSVIALLLSISMLIGTTFAWFSDNISSAKNIITSGNLDLEMYWTDDLDSGKWYNVEDEKHNTIFSYDNWEPGYTDVKYIKLVNKGDLALNYNLSIEPENGVGKLAEVINVYYANDGIEVASRDDLAKMSAIGLLNNVMNGGATADGTLLAADQYSPVHPSGETIITLAMNMITSAGNDYKGKDAGEFTINALATQAPFEKDSFGSDYDADAEYPVILKKGSATADVVPVDGKVPAGGVTLSGDGISAVVPEGTLLEDGVDKLTLTVTPLKHTTSDITAVNSEILIPVDVHIDGVSENNTTPIIIDLGEVLPKYLNMGNYHLFHVEDGQSKVMTLVDDKADLNAHNQFTYDSDTGAVTVAMASFSEVVGVADTSNPWMGEVDYKWYNTTDTTFTITKADQLYGFAKIVGGMAEDYPIDSFSGKTVKLLSDINLNHGNVPGNEGGITKIFYPIGYYNKINDAASGYYDRVAEVEGQKGVTSNVSSFSGTFNGNGHTIYNFYQNTWEMFGDYNDGYSGTPNYYKDAMGLFGYVNGGTVKNLTVDHFESDGEFTPTGVIAAYAANSTFENIAITNCNPRVYNTGNGGIIGIAGRENDAKESITLKNITVDNSNKITALWGSWDVACGGLMGMFRGNGSVDFTNCHAAAQIDVYNDVCGNYQYYWYRYAGMMIGSLRGRNVEKDGYTVPSLDGITATGCSVSFDAWNDYYYCELVDNSIASYTHDHQFSRLVEVKEVDVTNKTYVPVGSTESQDIPKSGRYNYVVVTDKVTPSTEEAECYHFVDGVQHKHESKGTEIVDGTEYLVEDKQHVYLPFNQVFQGDGWGVKHIAIVGDEGTNLRDTYQNLDIEIRNRNTKEKFESNFTGEFLYRVGNLNTISVGTLFKAKDGAEINDSGVWVTVEKLSEEMNIKAKYTKSDGEDAKWTDNTLKFEGTGVAKITIQDYDYCTPTSIIVEVVDGYNVASYSQLKKSNANNVLVSNIKMTGGTTRFSNCTVFGNGFELDISEAANSGDSSIGDSNSNYSVIGLVDSVLDNISIKGAVYQSYGVMVSSEYSAAAVGTSGTCKITNSYISNCLSPVKALSGTVTLENTTLQGGRFCNLDVRGAHVILNGVTTINTSAGGTKEPEGNVLGLGIVVHYQNSDNAKITIGEKGLIQNNWLYIEGTNTTTGDYQYFNATGITDAFKMMFGIDSKYSVNGKTYVNTGIVTLNTSVDENDITIPSNYAKESVSYSGNNGYLWTPNAYDANTLSYEEYQPSTQGDFEPVFSWNHPDSEYVVEGNKITISFNEGESYAFSTTYPTATKAGKKLDVTVKKDDVACGDTVTFTESGEYVFTYEYTDPYRYAKDGSIAASKTYKQTLNVKVSAIELATPAPTFTFVTQSGTNGGTYAGTYSGQAGLKNGDINGDIKTVEKDGQLWIMPNVTAADTTIFGGESGKSGNGMKGSIGYVNGVYFPIVTGEIESTAGTILSNGTIKRHYPFYGRGGTSGSITISDSGITYNSDNASTNLLFYSEYNGTQGVGVGSADDFGLADGVTSCGESCSKCGWGITSGAISGGDASSSPANYGNNLDSIYYAKYSYTAANGQTYYYYVGYSFAQDTSAAKQGGCFTSDTLITLADGTQKRVDNLSFDDKILAWDFFIGEYVQKDISILVNHGAEQNEVIYTKYSDGTLLKLIAEHGVFDYDLNQFVYITAENVKEFVGHSFVKQNLDGGYDIVTMTEGYVVSEYVEAWSVSSAGTSNAFASGLLTVAPPEDFYNWITMDEKLHYDVEQFAKDVETYGLYNYEEFKDYVTYEQFVAWNGAYLKVPVEKGYFTFEYILELIELYKGWMPQN